MAITNKSQVNIYFTIVKHGKINKETNNNIKTKTEQNKQTLGCPPRNHCIGQWLATDISKNIK